ALFLVRISPELPRLLTLGLYAGVGAAVFLMMVWASGFPLIGYARGLPAGAAVAMALIRFVPNLTTSVSFLIEFLAAIPSIAYGLWGLFVMKPFLQQRLRPLF